MSKRKIKEDQATTLDADKPTIQDGNVPPNIVQFRNAFGDKAIVCKCGAVATTAEEAAESGYSHMECVLFSCYLCTNRGWAWCAGCGIRFRNSNVHLHVKTKKHIRNVAKKSMAMHYSCNTHVNKQTNQAVPRGPGTDTTTYGETNTSPLPTQNKYSSPSCS
jgi:hypothetical protein